MSIKKILLLASMALAAIAFAAPAAAQANIKLTDDPQKDGSKESLAVGAKVTATSTDLQTHTAAGTISCELVTLHLEVKTNGNEHAVLEPVPLEPEMTTQGCLLHQPEATWPVTVLDGTVGELTIDTWGTANVETTFNSVVYADAGHTMPVARCHFASTGIHFQAQTGVPDGDVLNIAGGAPNLTVSGEACPEAPKKQGGEITGNFTLETPDKTPVTIDFVNTEAPATVKLTDDPQGDGSKEALKVEAKVTATSTNLETHTAIGSITCELVTLHQEVVTNGSKHVVLRAVPTAPEMTTEGCFLRQPGQTLPMTIFDGTVGEVTINTWGTANVETTFNSVIYADAGHTMPVASCHFAGNAIHVQAQTGVPDGDVLRIPPIGKSNLTVSGEACPEAVKAGGAEITGNFTLETPDKTPVTIDFVDTEA